jgi:O-antigen/teichoic acid export membrane protein
VSFLSNVSWALRGNIFYAVTQWTLLIVLAKLGGPEVVGRYTLGLAVTAPIVLFTDLQLRSLLASDVNGKYQVGDYVLVRALTNTFALLLICAIVLGFDYTRGQAIVILLIGLAKVVESSSDILYGVMQRSERMDLVGISKVLRGAATVVCFGFTLYFTGSLIGGLVSLIFVWLLVLVLVDYQNAFRLIKAHLIWTYGVSSRRQWSWGELLALARQSLPLGVVSMLISYNYAVPRYFLELYHGEAALGYFSAIAYLSVAITIIIEALGQAVLPRLAEYYERERPKYWRSLLMLSSMALGVGCFGVFVSILIGRPMLSLIYRPDYGQFTDVLVLIMMLGVLESLCSVFGVGLTVARVLRLQVSVLMMVLSISTLAGWWLIPQYAVKGAVMAAIVSTLMWASAYALAIGYFSHRFRGESAI